MSRQKHQVDHYEFGQEGFDYIIGSETGEWIAIQVIGTAGATLSATSAIGDNLPSFEASEGMVIVGKFSAIDVTSGAVIAYRK